MKTDRLRVALAPRASRRSSALAFLACVAPSILSCSSMTTGVVLGDGGVSTAAAVDTAGKKELASPAASPPAWTSLAPRLRSPDLVDRVLEASGLLLGTTYEGGPLGEGDGATVDSDPRVDFTKVDCVTYLEESLALALSARRTEADFMKILDAIRYANGEVEFAARNHYMMRDWVPANAWLVDDVTKVVGPGKTRVIKKTIDRATFLRDQGAAPRPGVDDAGALSFDALPLAALAAVGSELRSGDLLLWVAKKDGIDIAHTGMVMRDPKDGSLVHRHASSKSGKAVDEPLLAYAGRSTFFDGVVVLRVKPEAAPSGYDGDE